MRLTDHDLKQMNQEYLASLRPGQLLHLSQKMLTDLRSARDQLNQTPQNSSRPSGSFAPWQQTGFSDKQQLASKEIAPEEKVKPEKADKQAKSQPQEEVKQATQPGESKRKAGKQPGAKGIGRRLEMAVTGEEVHKVSACTACGASFAEGVAFQAKTGLYVLDIERTAHGLQITHIKHIYGERVCGCGHATQTKPGRHKAEQGWTVRLTEWHLVGPTLAALIICLSLRMRLSRRRVRELLQDWLGVTLSVGSIDQCISEGGRACAPLEAELVAEIQQAELLYADETGWKVGKQTAWLWVLRTATVTLYMIGRRSWTVIAKVMEQYGGWLMSDGYPQYRKYGKRLRCLAHIIRKARGLTESVDPAAAEFGQKVLETMRLFIKGIYAARGDPTIKLPKQFSRELLQLQKLSVLHRDHAHVKTKKLARELLNDWEAIWKVLEYPHLPITNNVAERALRHWVIARKLSYGTRTEQGSHAYTLLASVIDTCRQRGVSPWPYIAEVITERRKGNAAPSLPAPILMSVS